MLDRPIEHTCVVGDDVAACAGIVSIVVAGLLFAIKCRDSLQSGPRWRILHVRQLSRLEKNRFSGEMAVGLAYCFARRRAVGLNLWTSG